MLINIICNIYWFYNIELFTYSLNFVVNTFFSLIFFVFLSNNFLFNILGPWVWLVKYWIEVTYYQEKVEIRNWQQGKLNNFSLVSIYNLVQFLYACKFSSPTDKGNLNETNTDFLHQISEYFECIFSSISIIIWF